MPGCVPTNCVRCLRPHLLMLAAMAWLGGCEDESIRSYTAPKDPARAVQQQQMPTAPPSAAAAASATWVKPPDWRVDPQGASFAMASFLAGPTDAASPVRITLTRLGGDGGGLLPNLNRWRGQLKLDPIASLDEQQAQTVAVDGIAAVLVDLAAQEAYGSDGERAVGVMAFRRADSWFVKMTGPSSAIEAARPAFDDFVASIRLPQESSPQ